jgi:type IV secretion system protein VirB8
MDQNTIKFSEQEILKIQKKSELSRTESLEKSQKIAWRLVAFFGFLSLISVVAVALLAPYKELVPFIVRVDNNTGLTDTVTYVKDLQTTQDEVMDKFFLKRYVDFRESYDWESLSGFYGAVVLMSDTKIASDYMAFFKKQDAPHKVLANKARVIVDVKAITFVGDVAQVRFTKRTIANNEEVSSTKWIASIVYKYVGTPMKENDRNLNPLGFKVTSYRVDQEL